MKQITNIYILVDTSFRNERNKEKLQTILNKYSRALNFEKGKAKLHIIGYNDKAKIIEPFKRITTNGNPNLGEGLKLLENVIKYQRKYDEKQTRSVFILHGSDNVLQGWNAPLERLFELKEFAFGLRYVVQYGNPDKYAKQAYLRFTESNDKILPYFSENRLTSLLSTIRRVNS